MDGDALGSGCTLQAAEFLYETQLFPARAHVQHADHQVAYGSLLLNFSCAHARS
jgi:hypothetical protein